MKRYGLTWALLVSMGVVLWGCQPQAMVQPADQDAWHQAWSGLSPEGCPMVLVFTSPYCAECQKLHPKLVALPQALPGLRVRDVPITSRMPAEKAVMASLQIESVPYVAFVSGEGRVQQVIDSDVPQSALESAARALGDPTQCAARGPSDSH